MVILSRNIYREIFNIQNSIYQLTYESEGRFIDKLRKKESPILKISLTIQFTKSNNKYYENKSIVHNRSTNHADVKRPNYFNFHFQF